MARMQMAKTVREQMLAIDHDVLELIATGESLSTALAALCRRVEAISPSVIASILAVRDGRLRMLAGPSLSEAYTAAIDGVAIGPLVGSCGTAAYYGRPVEITDIANDPHWVDFRECARHEGLAACWSIPILARHGHVIGTFAFYYRDRRGPSDIERLLVARCVHLCSIAIENDIARSDMHRLAYYDQVTRLMNRASFQSRLEKAVVQAASYGEPYAIHLIDLDDFKQINDTFGHPVGDELLAAIAQRLQAVVRDHGEVARIGGDEFAVIAPCDTRDAAGDLAWRLLATFATPFVLDEQEVKVDASIGIAMTPEDGVSLPQIMKNADLALYSAKADGKGRYRFFVPVLAEAARERSQMAGDLKRALENEEFVLMYQPIVNLGTRVIAGCEALLRWNHPKRGLVSPASFLPLAEELGLINQIGEWVLSAACRDAASWPADVSISVNISPVQLRSPRFVAVLQRALEWSGLAPERLILEITESAVLSEDCVTFESLRVIKQLKVGIALDDFGTGYSSLRALRAVPLDCIKIDQSFVVELGQAPASTSIIRAVIALARSMNISTTAEGIETNERAWQLLAEGCDFGQGHFLGMPMELEAFHAFLAADRESGQLALGR